MKQRSSYWKCPAIVLRWMLECEVGAKHYSSDLIGSSGPFAFGLKPGSSSIEARLIQTVLAYLHIEPPLPSGGGTMLEEFEVLHTSCTSSK